MVLRHNAAFSDLINDVTEIDKLVRAHTDLQMCPRKFRPIKYTRRYSYAKFGTFFWATRYIQCSAINIHSSARSVRHLHFCFPLSRIDSYFLNHSSAVTIICRRRKTQVNVGAAWFPLRKNEGIEAVMKPVRDGQWAVCVHGGFVECRVQTSHRHTQLLCDQRRMINSQITAYVSFSARVHVRDQPSCDHSLADRTDLICVLDVKIRTVADVESRAVVEKPHNVVLKFDTYRNLQQHRAVLSVINIGAFCRDISLITHYKYKGT